MEGDKSDYIIPKIQGQIAWLILLAAVGFHLNLLMGAWLGGIFHALIIILIFCDAWTSGIYKPKTRVKSFYFGFNKFLNFGPLGWSLIALLFAFIALPVYFLVRNKLKTIKTKNIFFILLIIVTLFWVGLWGYIYFFNSIKYNLYGHPEGPYKTYYMPGKIREEGTYNNGIIEGLVKDYYDTGELQVEGTFKVGKKEGSYKNYYKTGKVQQEGIYKNDKLEGPVKYYYDTGELQGEETCQNGKREGPGKFFYKTGQIQEEGLYKNDKLEGSYKYYSDRGLLLRNSNYRNGQLDGKDEFYYINGVIQYTDIYKNGNKLNRKAYDVDGKLKFDQNY